MCSILGFIGKGSEADAKRMLDTVRHRGPDDEGIVSTPEVTLGFARLSIIDTTLGSHQPMWSKDKRICVVFNGEIYNFRELRERLEKKGYEFATTGDAEVVVNSYLEYGEGCFAELSGMFGIAIYDFSEKKLMLARDRLGKKPLYYFNHKGTFGFASELKAVAVHSSFVKEIDVESVNLYLQYDYVPTPKTIYKNTFKLEPGSYLTYKDSKSEIKPFWKLDPKPFTGTFAEAKNELNRLIEMSVRDRLVADVPLGVFLSGGLDSTAVAHYAAKNSKEKIKTFSVGFEEKSFDESRYAREAALFLGTDHHEKIMKTEDLLAVFKDLGRLVDEPLADASIVPTYLLSKFAKEQVTVALGGDGADELFAGYPTFIAAKIYGGYQKMPGALKLLVKKTIGLLPVSHSNFSIGFMLRKFVEASGESLVHAHQVWLGSFTRAERSALFLSKYTTKIKSLNEFDVIDGYENAVKNMSTHNRILFTYLRTYLMDGVMVKVDRSSMFASLEARSPLLDTRIVEFAFSLPYSWKLRGLTTKYIFKKLMAYKIPRGIVYRKKKGFGMPIGRWFREDLRDFLDTTLSKKEIEKGGLFDYGYINKLKQEHFAGTHDHRKKLWNLLVLELWRKQNNV